MLAERYPAERYAALAAERGIDAATEALLQAVLADPENASFLDELAQAGARELPTSRGSEPIVWIAPAAFYREYPRFQGDGLAVRRVARKLGLEARVLPSRSTGSVSDNARRIAEALALVPDGSAIVVSLSKGGADLRLAFEREPKLARKTPLWLQIGGLLRGTPVVNELQRGGWLQRGLLRGYLALTIADPALVTEMQRGPDTLLSRPPRAPEGVRVVNVVGFPLSTELRGRVRGRHARLAHLGPNDGMGVLCDAIVEPGVVVPIRGADHYFRSSAVPPAVEAILRWWLVTGAARWQRKEEGPCLASSPS